jgi:2-phospho-L-lactate guanylyltransferase
MTSAPRPTVLIPVNATGEAKSRLSEILSTAERRELVLALTRDLFDHLESLGDRVRYGVVTSQGEVGEIVRERGGFVVGEPDDAESLGQIVDGSLRPFEDSLDGGLLVMPVDLPRVDVTALEKLLDRVRESSVYLVPDEEQAGTNVLWRNPPLAIECQYEGTESFEAHVAAAERAGYSPEVERPAPFRFDLDTPEDWHRLTQSPDQLSEHTGEFVADFMIDINRSLSG